MKIQDTELDIGKHFLSPVTYVPTHAKGNAGHDDCEPGVLISWDDGVGARVLYSKSRTVQLTYPEDLVWG